MNESLLFYTAVFAFSMMIIGLVLTVLEFRSLTKRDRHSSIKTPFIRFSENIQRFSGGDTQDQFMEPIPIRDGANQRRA